MPSRKYATELTLGLASEKCYVLRPCDIVTAKQDDQYRDELRQCHIYAIAKHPRVTLVPGSLRTDEVYLYGKLRLHCQGGARVEDFRTPHGNAGIHGLRAVASEYPHDVLLWRYCTGELATAVPIALVAHAFEGAFHHLLGYEIVYIGQAYGPDGHRSALDRLASHSTLQKIQADVMAHSPDSDLALLLFRYVEPPYYFFEIDRHVTALMGNDEDRRHYTNAIWQCPPEGHNITLAEAGLIRYFQPYYNRVYKNSFPSTNLECLQKCYDLDFHSLVVEVDSGKGAPPMYSDAACRSVHHVAFYNLHHDDARRAFFGPESVSFT